MVWNDLGTIWEGFGKLTPAVGRNFRVLQPISARFPDIKQLSRKQREEWMIMDDQYFSFEALSKIYSVKDLLRL
jgi:hypothetical protein